MNRLGQLSPLLVAAVPIVFAWGHNANGLEASRVLPWLAVALAGTAVWYAAMVVLLRDVRRAAVVASLGAGLFFLYGHAFDLLRRLGWVTNPRMLHALVGTALIGILLAVGRRVRRSTDDLAPLTRAIALAAMISLALSGREIVKSHRRAARRAIVTQAAPTPTPLPAMTRADAASAARPDVYFIILDGYARADVLRRLYDFDDTPFLDALRQRGFVIAERSTANYPLTFLSLAATLEMDLLDDTLTAMGKNTTDERPIVARLQNNLVGRTFRAQGYQVVHFQTNYGPTEHVDYADVTYAFGSVWLKSEFASVLLRTTPLRLFEPNVSELYQYMFRTLAEVPHLVAPTFAFCHLTVPHHPYVFDREGRVLQDMPFGLQFTGHGEGWTERHAYIEQLEYVNRRILEVLDAILAASSPRPIIILQSDHGSASSLPERTASDDAWHGFARERMANLNAWLAPAAIQAKVRSDVSSVNTFRILLSALFGADLPELPDRSLLARAMYDRPYDFEDVTAVVR